MVQKNKTFTPHVLAITVGTVVDFPNYDPIFHNAFSNYNGQIFDLVLYPPGTTKSLAFRREGVVRVFCNIHPSMSAVIVVLKSPYFATSAKNGGFEIAHVPAGSYRMHVFHERASEQTLAALTRSIEVGDGPLELAPIQISESGYLELPHKNKFGKDYPPVTDSGVYVGTKPVTFSRLSLLWKILIPISLVMTLAFAIAGWLIQRDVVRDSYASVEQEAKASFQAYESLWKERANRLGAISEILSTMSDVRAAFGTGDAATIRDTAGELWSKVSKEDAFFLVADGQGSVVASLGPAVSFAPNDDLPMVRAARAQFPGQASGFVQKGDELFQVVVTPIYVQSPAGPVLLNVLLAGYRVDAGVAQTLKNSTGGSEYVFVSRNRVVTSTLTPAITAAIAPRLLMDSTDIPDYLAVPTALRDISGAQVGQLFILRSLAGARQRLAALRREIIALWLLALVAALIITYLVARKIMQPVAELDRAAAEIGKQNYDYQIDVRTQDELGRLARTFQSMCESIRQAREELIRQGAHLDHRTAFHFHRARPPQPSCGHLRGRRDDDGQRYAAGDDAPFGPKHLPGIAWDSRHAPGIAGRGARHIQRQRAVQFARSDFGGLEYGGAVRRIARDRPGVECRWMPWNAPWSARAWSAYSRTCLRTPSKPCVREAASRFAGKMMATTSWFAWRIPGRVSARRCRADCFSRLLPRARRTGSGLVWLFRAKRCSITAATSGRTRLPAPPRMLPSPARVARFFALRLPKSRSPITHETAVLERWC